jgi:quinohemoprotein amine dehydrogenase
VPIRGGRFLIAMAALFLGGLIGVRSARAESLPGNDLLRTYCSGCHQEKGGQFDRISAIRKTPEGWVMTLARMRQVHGLALSDETRDAVVRFLSDSQGLAPSESAAGRFALERQPNAQDLDLGPEMTVMCGRCHTLARISLQRRDQDEWLKLAHTHLGQWPSLEYQASGRDRHWWEIASGPMPAQLAALYPLRTAAWTTWQQHPAANLAGTWVVVGRVPGGRDFFGTARIEADAGGNYTASYQLTDIEGTSIVGESKAIVYTKFEWRGSAKIADRSRREVYHVSEDGNLIKGRWFDAQHDEDGGEWTAVREGGPAKVLAVWPQALRAGTAANFTLVGTGLTAGELSLGESVSATNMRRDAHVIRARIAAVPTAASGMRRISVGGAEGHLAVYQRIDAIEVLPKFGIARLGGGRVDPVSAQFEAQGSMHLSDGQWLPLGPVTVSWSTEPFNDEAKRTEDEKFAGYIDRRGRFLPSAAGPNPAREFSGNNVGDLAVVAHTEEAGRDVIGKGHLIVTVQRWITPPIY